ncbi:DUF4145 domain-containing protein [Pseudomonas rubra]|uniref:DUF4145 domain-containing protein n=1 Tax=Pseudomonas rubra TaxID=2942627 RepID=A0ABT5PEU2_9PSED|nr:DUF4145 domain-containing protein [Pseudomonas rubra]MDD1016828.1 DUF4145 domain-containing protein [Pseudomonas rubra]MDD1041467.1 DUF4145 domain-containing protein [Pseudomonas rubra]MDD1154972.1 DUF4145 domain-containing protein [Pseudomonas rubra]
MKLVPPAFKAKAFTCIFCGVLTSMEWVRLCIPQGFGNGYNHTSRWDCTCNHCSQVSLWLDQGEDFDEAGNRVSLGRLLDPSACVAPLAHIDLPEECKRNFDEAREISVHSARGAAALLRLCLQRLCIQLGGKGKDINEDIAQLVKGGLAPQIQMALDYVRVTGNHAVHPGKISEDDMPEHVGVMFAMINWIVEDLIHRPKLIAEKFEKLPEGVRKQIENRDKPKPNVNGG